MLKCKNSYENIKLDTFFINTVVAIKYLGLYMIMLNKALGLQKKAK